jgi:phage gpG-like protein
MFELHITPVNLNEFLASLERVAASLRDFRFIFPKLADHFYDIEKQTFASQGRQGSWPALTTRYAKWKAAKFPGRPILQREGLLLASLTQKSATGSIYRESALSLTLGSSHPAALVHQTGGKRIPARPPIDFTPQDIQDFGDIIAKETTARMVEIAGFREARLAA